MVRFIPAATLKGQYSVWGHFYTVDVTPEKVVECRSVLEIIAHTETPDNPSAISRRTPDAVFIMMNPGSSRPLVDVHNRVSADGIHELPISLVPTKPDTTQYQVMRLMHYCDWQHVRVLNLSDLRCSKSGLFFQQFAELEKSFAYDAHSVFSDRRRTELAAKLTQDKALPVIRAWGVSPQLEPLIERCASHLTRARSRFARGLLKEGTANKFLHPLPSLQSQQMEWVNRMVEQCRDEAG